MGIPPPIASSTSPLVHHSRSFNPHHGSTSIAHPTNPPSPPISPLSLCYSIPRDYTISTQTIPLLSKFYRRTSLIFLIRYYTPNPSHIHLTGFVYVDGTSFNRPSTRPMQTPISLIDVYSIRRHHQTKTPSLTPIVLSRWTHFHSLFLPWPSSIHPSIHQNRTTRSKKRHSSPLSHHHRHLHHRRPISSPPDH